MADEEAGDIDYAAVKYVYVPALGACSADLGDLSDGELCNRLASFIAENGITGTKYAIGKDGKVKASDLSLGAYIVKQTVAGEGYFPFNTFLITVPVLDKGEWPIPVFALAGLVTFMLGWFIYKSDNDEESE